jgi:cytochrome P450 family 710 subfamily A protein
MEFTSVLYIVIKVVSVIFLLHHIYIQRRAKHLPGPSWTWPCIGSVVSLVRDPVSFWNRQEAYGSRSWNYIAGWFMINCNDTTDIRKIFNNKGELKLELHPNARRILGSNNLAFMHGEEHKALRQKFIRLFTAHDLSIYLELQSELINRHIDRWIETSEKTGYVRLRDAIRMLNIETSQHVFVGPYLTSASQKQMEEDYNIMNQGFLALPINLPGTRLYKACQARERIVTTLEQMVKRSRVTISEGQSPQCLLDFLMRIVVENPDVPHFQTDRDIACLMLDFLFASQDASTSSLCWICTILADRPTVLERVRDEQDNVRPNNEPITLETLKQLTYTQQVVYETLRYRAPATMVPHVTVCPFQLGDIDIPKGTLVMPNILAAHRAWKNGEEFDPERFKPGTERDAHEKFLTFGYGPHVCLGQNYALNHLKCFLSILSTRCDWYIARHAKSMEYGPTIHPGDDCLVVFHERSVEIE